MRVPRLRPPSQPPRLVCARPSPLRPKQQPTHPALSQCRAYAKRRTKTSLAELPQGALPLAPLPPESTPSKKYPTVIAQARNNMDMYKSCVLLTRVGGFYELYFEHAEEFAPRLGIKVAKKRTLLGPVSMAGFPYYGLERVLKALVQEDGHYVAVAEEFPADNPDGAGPEGGLMWERRIARVVTPGTFIDERFLEAGEWNFLLAVSDGHDDESIGLAWLDLGTGDFFTQQSNRAMLAGDIGRIGPREILLASETSSEMLGLGLAGDSGQATITYHSPPVSALRDWSAMLESPIPPQTLSTLSEAELCAGDRLLSYVATRLPGLALKLQPPIRRSASDAMAIDAASLRGLEIRTTLRDHTVKGSLLHTIDRTVTRSGARLLAARLLNPATDVSVIEARLELVDVFTRDQKLREHVLKTLRRTHDSQRILQKFSLGRGDAEDLLALARTIRCTDTLAEALTVASSSRKRGVKKAFKQLIVKLQSPGDLAQRIENAIDEEGLYIQLREENEQAAEHAENLAEAAGEPIPPERRVRRRMVKERESERMEAWVMQKSASFMLRRLHDELEALEAEKNKLELELQKELDVTTLRLRWTPGLGHICHVRGRAAGTIQASLPDARSVSSSRSTHSFHLPVWTSLGALMDAARLRIRAEEAAVFSSLRTHVVTHLATLRQNAATLDALDVASSLAELATELAWSRPRVTHANTTHIVGGRHPTVEAGLREAGRTFVPNDLFLTASPAPSSSPPSSSPSAAAALSPPERIWLLTGPNMAGKSTFLRQNALITILAQAGSFVPAAHAELGVVDAVFSRVGSADNLFRDQSTFMVEMLETAGILRAATERSFVIMDEVGRGTTPRDGVAVAYAVVRALGRVRCRALFASHFHELADLLGIGGDAEEEGKEEEGRSKGDDDDGGEDEDEDENGVEEGEEGEEEGKENGQTTADGVAAYCTSLVEAPDGAWSYGYRLRRGVNRESHALKVARLAGIPGAVIAEAERVVDELKRRDAEGRGGEVSEL